MSVLRAHRWNDDARQVSRPAASLRQRRTGELDNRLEDSAAEAVAIELELAVARQHHQHRRVRVRRHRHRALALLEVQLEAWRELLRKLALGFGQRQLGVHQAHRLLEHVGHEQGRGLRGRHERHDGVRQGPLLDPDEAEQAQWPRGLEVVNVDRPLGAGDEYAGL
jgi:hypothetical protein